MPAFVLPTVASTDLQVYKQSSFEHGKFPPCPKCNMLFFFGGCMGCFPLTNKPMKLKLFGSLSFFVSPAMTPFHLLGAFFCFIFARGMNFTLAIHQGFNGPRKADLHQTRCSLCEFKSHPKSNLFQG